MKALSCSITPKCLVAAAALLVGCVSVTKPVVPEGRWTQTNAEPGDWLEADGLTVRIGRKGQAAYAVLENRADGSVLYAQDDPAQRHPQRLVLRDDGSVEYSRDEAPPFSKQSSVFEKVEPK